MFNLPKRDKPDETSSPYDSPKESTNEASSKSKDKNRLSRYSCYDFNVRLVYLSSTLVISNPDSPSEVLNPGLDFLNHLFYVSPGYQLPFI